MPADASLFRAYDLNQSLNPSKESICQPADWTACERKELPERQGGCVVGFDLGGSSSMTALAAFWPSTGRLEVWGAFPDNPSLAERGRADGVGGLYEQMAARGELRTYKGRITPVAEFLRDCAERLSSERILAAGADRYRRAECETALEDAGLDWQTEWRGQGASAGADGSHDIRAFQRLVLGGRLAVRESLLLRSAVASSELRYDGAGNPGLNKRKARARIDALSAAVIAAGLGEIYASAPRPQSRALSWPCAGVLICLAFTIRRNGALARSRALNRDGYRCRHCGRSGRLEVHHLHSLRDGGDNSLDNLVTLCREHHIEIHRQPKTANEKAWANLLLELMK